MVENRNGLPLKEKRLLEVIWVGLQKAIMSLRKRTSRQSLGPAASLDLLTPKPDIAVGVWHERIGSVIMDAMHGTASFISLRCPCAAEGRVKDTKVTYPFLMERKYNWIKYESRGWAYAVMTGSHGLHGQVWD